MGLSEIATALETTTIEQRSRCVPTVGGTDISLRERFEAYTDAFPCTPAVTERVVEAHGSSTSVGASVCDAGVTPVTAAKLLHRCGEAGMTLFVSEARHVIRDWIDGRILRAGVLVLTGTELSGFTLATHVETYNPIDLLIEAVKDTLADRTDATTAKRSSPAETMSSITDMQF